MSTTVYAENGIRQDIVDALWDELTDEERALVERDLLAIDPPHRGAAVSRSWRERIPATFPRYASAPFATRHEEFWEWENAIELHSAPDPFVGIWPRGGAKSTSVEMGVTDLGCNRKRRYCLYVRMTQDKADASVENIAALLESDEVAHHYPEHSKRKTGKFGNAKGWRRNRVWTQGGFVVDALGLDTASRGVKVEDQRPDLIVFDDIDDLMDGPAQTKKKIDIITKSIMPAGSNNVAVIFIQNLIIRDGVASQLADGRADFLSKRIVSGPFPAVEELQYKWELDETTGMRHAVIVGGKPTWAGQDLATCQRNIDQWGLSAFLKEAQHKVQGKGEGVSLNFDRARHLNTEGIAKTPDEWIALVRRSKAFGGIDFGAWRFGFTLWIVTTNGLVLRVDELFSQKESLEIRARKIHELCVANGIDNPTPKLVPIWGDAANPQDIMEINLAWKRIGSKLRVIAVASENKLRQVAVERINNALDQNIIRFRRDCYEGQTWLLGMNAGSPGTEMTGSRLVWEMDNWAVPLPKEGEAQSQNPDDDTADGADMIAATRYALMSHWRPGKVPAETEVIEDDRAWEFDVKKKKFKEPPHAVDIFNEQPNWRRAPSVRGVRPRVKR